MSVGLLGVLAALALMITRVLGLLIALRGTEPGDRAEIIRALNGWTTPQLRRRSDRASPKS